MGILRMFRLTGVQAIALILGCLSILCTVSIWAFGALILFRAGVFFAGLTDFAYNSDWIIAWSLAFAVRKLISDVIRPSLLRAA